MKEKKNKYKKVNESRLLEKTSDGIKVNPGSNLVAVEVSEDNNCESDDHRIEDGIKNISIRHNRSENLTFSENLLDEGMSCSEKRAIDKRLKRSRKSKNKQNNLKEERKQKGIADFNSLKNATAEGGANFEGEIIHGGPMGGEKDQKMQRKRKENENSTTCTDNCDWDEDKKQDRKRKKKKYFPEHVQDHGNLKKIAKESSEKAYKIISGSDTEYVPSRTSISIKDKKRGEENEDVASCSELTLKMATKKEKGDKKSTAATTKYSGKGTCNSESNNCEQKTDAKEGKKKVSFSKEVEEFPLDQFSHEKMYPDGVAWGKRFTPEEDEFLKKAIMNYIEVNQLGEQGLHMVLHCKSFRREVKGCWKDISAALPWRHRQIVSARAHVLYERSEERKWEPEELELLKRYYAEHGPKWRKLADILGKCRSHVKDAWRRIKLPNINKGKWSQVEYQSLFDLVNLDLRMKAYEEKKDNHSLLKDNISWEAISSKMSTRGAQSCCLKWYYHLSTSMISEGKWSNVDDYKLIEAIQNSDVCCFEDVDWDNLLPHRSGEYCRKRWYEMIRHLEKFWAMPFVEQVDSLSERYSPDMIQYREMAQNKNNAT